MECFRAGIDGLGDLMISALLTVNCGMYELGSIAVGFFAWRVVLGFRFVTSLPALRHTVFPFTPSFVVQTDVKA